MAAKKADPDYALAIIDAWVAEGKIPNDRHTRELIEALGG